MKLLTGVTSFGPCQNLGHTCYSVFVPFRSLSPLPVLPVGLASPRLTSRPACSVSRQCPVAFEFLITDRRRRQLNA